MRTRSNTTTSPIPDTMRGKGVASSNKRKSTSSSSTSMSKTSAPTRVTSKSTSKNQAKEQNLEVQQAQLRAHHKEATTNAHAQNSRKSHPRPVESSEEEDEPGNREEYSPPPKKARHNTIEHLDDEEMGIANRFEPLDIPGRGPEEDSDSHPQDEDEGDEGNNGHNELDFSEDDDQQEEQQGVLDDNGFFNVDADNQTKSKISSTKQSRRSWSHSRSGSPSSTPGNSTLRGSHNYKVVEADFTPRTRRLAISSKSHVRMTSIYHPKGPFLMSNRLERLQFTWDTIRETSKLSNSNTMKDALRRASTDDSLKQQLMTFTMYGRTALISNIITKARNRVKGFYGLKGDNIREDVDWLLKESRFMYGGVNVEKHEYDLKKPFGCDLIIEIIESQWFSTSSRSTADAETTAKIAAEKDLPLSIILLSLTVIEHALKEWQNGRKASKLNFSEDIAKQSYNHHLGNWKLLTEKAPNWAKVWKRQLVKRILDNHEDVYGDSSNGSDLAKVDFAQLDAAAAAEMEESQENE